MNKQQIREIIIDCLGQIAPEADLKDIDPDTTFHNQFDFDSIDCLNLVTAIGKRTGRTIPEADYPQLSALNGCIRYLSSR